MDNKRQELLHTPEGVWDHYGRDAAEYDTVSQKILERLRSYGYEDLRTPTFEFFDVFSKEIGTTSSRELYKFFDKDGETLVLRPDFTPSAARCAAKYFMDDTKPLRFCYSGSTFVNNSNLQGKLKEATQMGAELMNDDSPEADAEQLALLIESLLSTGLTDLQITLGNAEYFKGLCEDAGLDSAAEGQLRTLISGKNYYAAESFLAAQGVSEEQSESFLKFTGFMKNDVDLRRVMKTTTNARSKKALERLCEVYRLLGLYGLSQYVSFDLSLLSRYQYYTGIMFKGYTYGVGDAIAAGGRYDKLLSHFGKDAAAVGFVIQLDAVLEALRTQKIEIVVPDQAVVISYREDNFAEALKKAQEIRKAGGRAVMQKES